MKEKNPVVLEAIDIAMEAERKANKFYSNAVEKTTNERGKNLLRQLANFEQSHYNALSELKASLNRDGKYINYRGTEFESVKITTSSEVAGKIEQNKDDVLNILTMAIAAETDANERYHKMAQETSNLQGKEMFTKLANEEMLHRRILSDEFYQLANQGGIWSWGD